MTLGRPLGATSQNPISDGQATIISGGQFSTLPLLEGIFGPCSDALPEPLVVSLDLEYESKPPLIHQIGVSVLDTYHLADIDVEELQSIAPSVSNHLFLLTRRRCRAYCYGDPLCAIGMSTERILHPFLVNKDEKGQPRNVVLVGHSIHQDLSMLGECGLDLDNLTQIRAYIDIAPFCAQVFDGVTHKMSLKHICQRLEIRTVSFHDAAHDALSTLQALLQMFSLHKDKMLASPDSIMQMSQDRREANRRIVWKSLLEILRFVGKELGNVLGTGSPKNRQRKQQREAYLRCLTLLDRGAPDISLKETITSDIDWRFEGWPLEATDWILSPVNDVDLISS